MLCSALQAILAAGFLPSALELADQFTLAAAAKYTKSRRLGLCKAHLIVELDGQEKSVRGELPAVEKIVRRFKPEFADRGLGDVECEKVWQIRRDFSFSLRATGLTKLNQDIVVPRGRLCGTVCVRRAPATSIRFAAGLLWPCR